jgi:hypothetical protein
MSAPPAPEDSMRPLRLIGRFWAAPSTSLLDALLLDAIREVDA